MGGDFNTILYASEKKGGVNSKNGVCPLLRNWFHSNNLCDLDFQGPRFIWSRGSLYKRLDRAVCNGEWLTEFPENMLLHLPKVGSDYRPILVKFGETNSASKANKPFRFLSAWLTNEKFGKFVASHWKSNTTFSDMIHDFTPKLLQWNKVIFGNIFQRKRRLLARLGGIQRALEVKYTRSLCHLEKKLKKELEEVLNQEEWFWHQKSRKDWALLGDRNTKFFHQKTLARRHRNCIKAIMDEKGSWLYEPTAIKQHAIDLFSSLYTNTDACFVSYPHGLFSKY